MSDLDFIGAGEGLGTKFVTLRVKRIDADKLRQKLGGMTAQAIPVVLPLIEQAPEAALRAAMPFATQKALTDYGVELEYQISDAPPRPGEVAPSKFGAGLVTGCGLMAAALWAWARVK